jgi:methionine synthase I (cobalamin-dependent)/5,10-methylenetetrahydrofolate reductase
MTLAEALERGTALVCDGAMGTMLHASGNSLDQALPALNLSDPALVKTIHDSYVGVGVDIIQTNTFGASRLRLAEHGHGDRAADINRAGVRIARDAARDGILVVGSVSPAVTVRQRGRVSPTARADALREQIEALADADAILLETFGYLEELVEAISVAVSVGGVPVMAQATFGPDLRMLSGHTAREMADAVAGSGIVTLGLNCTLGPQKSLAVLRELRSHSALPLSVQPNAGLPRRIAPARFEYDIDAEYFARYIRQVLDAGAAIAGGCCGTTPAHIAAAVEVARRPAPPAPAMPASVAHAPALVPARPVGDRTVVAEFTAPPGADVAETVALARALTGAGADAMSVVPSRARGNALDVAARLGPETIATVTTWDRTIMALQADLLGAHALGLRRIICETGNPPLLGDYPNVDGVWDVDSIGLIGLLASLNSGTDNYGLELGTKTGFEIGARINPGSRDLDREIARALAKISAGAMFLVTRPVYELGGLSRLLDAIDGQVPVLATIAPLGSFDDAEWLAHEVPDVVIPAAMLSALERAGASAPQVGVSLAEELAASLRGRVSGLVVAPAGQVVPPATPSTDFLPAAARLIAAWRD